MSGEPFFVLGTSTVRGTKTSVQRPSNTTAYALGDVYGAAGDARLELVVPSLPEDAYLEYFTSLTLKLLQHRDPTAAAFTLTAFVSLEPFATILGDNDPFVLSDADIENCINVASFPGIQVSLPTGANQAGALAVASGLNGRRTGRASATFENSLHEIVPGMTLGLYLVLATLYTPLADEVIDIYPHFATVNRIP